MLYIKINIDLERIKRIISGLCAGALLLSPAISDIGAAFAQCNNLESVKVSPENSKYSSYNGMLLNKAQTKLLMCHKDSTAEKYAKKNEISYGYVGKKGMPDAKITVAKAVYTGKALKPAVKVKLGSKTLKKGKINVYIDDTADIGTSSFRVTAAPDKSSKKGRVDIDAQGSTLKLSGLKSGKTYYVKARPYIEGYDPGKGKNVRYYGAGSKTVTIKCK